METMILTTSEIDHMTGACTIPDCKTCPALVEYVESLVVKRFSDITALIKKWEHAVHHPVGHSTSVVQLCLYELKEAVPRGVLES